MSFFNADIKLDADTNWGWLTQEEQNEVQEWLQYHFLNPGLVKRFRANW